MQLSDFYFTPGNDALFAVQWLMTGLVVVYGLNLLNIVMLKTGYLVKNMKRPDHIKPKSDKKRPRKVVRMLIMVPIFPLAILVFALMVTRLRKHMNSEQS